MADYRTVERPSEYNQVAEQRDRERAIAKVKKEQAGLEAAAERYERYKLKVRREEAEKAEQRQLEADALAAMSPQELYAFMKRVPTPELAPKPAPGYMMAVEDNRRDDAKAAIAQREAREQRAGLPKAQADYAAKVEAFRQERLEAEAEAEQAKRAAREREQEKLDELGEAPTLESLEAVTA
jgi:hypothetical protein